MESFTGYKLLFQCSNVFTLHINWQLFCRKIDWLHTLSPQPSWLGRDLEVIQVYWVATGCFCLLVSIPHSSTHSSIFAWRIPWTEETGELQSMGSQGLGCDWEINTSSNSNLGLSWENNHFSIKQPKWWSIKMFYSVLANGWNQA